MSKVVRHVKNHDCNLNDAGWCSRSSRDRETASETHVPSSAPRTSLSAGNAQLVSNEGRCIEAPADEGVG